MSERPFDPPPVVERRYGEMRCRRYLFDRPFDMERAERPVVASPKPTPEAERPQ